MGSFGRALNTAVPNIIQNVSNIQSLQERAQQMRLNEELQPYRMQQLQAETTLKQMSVQQRTHELKKQEEFMRIANQPRTLDDLLSFARGFAPNTTAKWKESLISGGAADANGTSSSQQLIFWGQANPLEFQGLMTEGIQEIEQSIAEKEKLIRGYTNEDGKFIPPDEKNAPILQNQIKQLRRGQQFLVGQSGELQQKIALEEMKQQEKAGTQLPIQSDKLQSAMAELGVDVRDPANYTPENISKASARLRAIEAQERRERGEELNAIQRSNIAHQLRTELRQDRYVQDFKDVDNKYKVMETAYNKSKTGKEKTYVAIDQALITLYNKMTDPSSVVRESEYARTPENMSIANRVLGKMDKWRQGGAGLTVDEREALVQMAREFYNKYSINYDQIVSDYEQTARESKIDPNLIGIPYRRKNIPQPSNQTSSGNRVKVISPNGKTGTIPKEQLQDALKQGYKQVQ